MSETNEWNQTWMSHVIYEWVMSHQDIYCYWYIWLEQSTKIWAIVCKTTILVIVVPFDWGMSLKHNEWIGRVLLELHSLCWIHSLCFRDIPQSNGTTITNIVVGRVLLELGSNQSRAQVKNLEKLNWRYGKDEFRKKNMSCRFGHVWTAISWVNPIGTVSSWITFWIGSHFDHD